MDFKSSVRGGIKHFGMVIGALSVFGSRERDGEWKKGTDSFILFGV